jgi:hypothetical protein
MTKSSKIIDIDSSLYEKDGVNQEPNRPRKHGEWYMGWHFVMNGRKFIFEEYVRVNSKGFKIRTRIRQIRRIFKIRTRIRQIRRIFKIIVKRFIVFRLSTVTCSITNTIRTNHVCEKTLQLVILASRSIVHGSNVVPSTCRRYSLYVVKRTSTSIMDVLYGASESSVCCLRYNQL